MPYQVTLKFGLQKQTKYYPAVSEARKAADNLAAFYAAKFGQATATVLSESGEELYIRIRNSREGR